MTDVEISVSVFDSGIATFSWRERSAQTRSMRAIGTQPRMR